MARKKAEPVYKGGYNAKELTQIDMDMLYKMPRSELAKAVSRLQDVNKKRLKTLEKNQEYTPAYYGMKKAMNNDMSVKGKDEAELRLMYKTQKSFYEAQTSTMKGAKEVLSAEEQRLGVKFDTKEKREDFWSIYDKFIEQQKMGKSELHNRGSDILQDKVADMFVNRDMTEEEILSVLKKQYEKEQKTDAFKQNKVVSDFYHLYDDDEEDDDI